MKRLSLTRLNSRLQRDPAATFPGDPCPAEGCEGVIHIYKTKTDAETGLAVRYLQCQDCHYKPEDNVWVE